MNLTRLMALGTLASHGPLHGHQIRRLAEVSDVGRWGGVSVGALYRELRLMEGEGLIRAIRTEQVGRRPARTVYSITGEGKLELALLRERAFRSQEVGPDPLGVALTFAMHGADRQQVTAWLAARRAVYAAVADDLAASRQRLLREGHIDRLAAANMRRGELGCRAEVAWHDELAGELQELPDEAWPGSSDATGQKQDTT